MEVCVFVFMLLFQAVIILKYLSFVVTLFSSIQIIWSLSTLELCNFILLMAKKAIWKLLIFARWVKCSAQRGVTGLDWSAAKSHQLSFATDT